MPQRTTPKYFTSQRLSPTFPKRWLRKIDKNGPVPKHVPRIGKCWIWKGCRDGCGYGLLGGNGKSNCIRAHVGAWLIHFGPIPDGILVCHKCDNPWCQRPSHFFLGTHLDNSRDSVKKHRRPVGEKCGTSRFTEYQISEIRRRYVRGSGRFDPGNSVQLRNEFGMSRCNFYCVVSRKTWKHI